MKILIQGLNFPPELVGIGKYTGEMVDYLIQQGHEVTVITAPPYYPMWKIPEGYSGSRYTKEKIGNLSIVRCPLWVPKKVTGARRIIHLMSYALSAFPVMIRQAFRKPDVIVTIAPAFTSTLNALITGWLISVPTWLHIQDFELDAAMNLGVIGNGGGLSKIALGLERLIFKRFTRVSSISHAMVRKMEKKGVDENRRVFFPNWVNADIIAPIEHSPMRTELGYTADDIVILYSGSMGVKQGLEVLVQSAEMLVTQPRIKFLLCGEGPVKDKLIHISQDLPNVRFLPLQPIEQLNVLLNSADIQVLPQRKDASDLMMPSKLLGMMASGKAIIAGCLAGSELFHVVNEVGVTVVPEDADAYVTAIEKLANDAELRELSGIKSRQYVCEHYSQQNVLRSFEKHLEVLGRVE